MGTELEILNERANRFMLFYIPYELFPNLNDEQKKQAEDDLFFGRLYLYKQDDIIVDFEKGLNQINLFSKKGLLENNLLRLIEIEEKGGNKSFYFLLEKYVSRIKGWEYIFEWLNNNAENNIVDLSISNKNLLQFQLDTTRLHLREIESHFGKKDNIASEDPESIFFENKGLVIAKGKTVHDFIKEKNDNDKKRQPLITNAEADRYLLETIFNVDNIYH
jgi:hypothetical protein